MKKFIHWTRLVHEIVRLLDALMRILEQLIEIVNKAVNCCHAPKLRVFVY